MVKRRPELLWSESLRSWHKDTTLLAIGILLAIIPLIWLGQTALLLAAGLPVRRRISLHDAPSLVRIGGRLITQAGIAAAVVAYPLATGRSVGAYYLDMLPSATAVRHTLHGFALALLYLTSLYLAWNLSDAVRFSLRRRPGRLVRHLLALPFSAALGAGAEELLFRGMLLNGLMKSIPAAPAVLIGAAAFAVAHYVREVKRWWTFPGHLMLGTCLCLAFLGTGSLWLPFGLHAGGIYAIMAARPFVRYEGPAWLTGASIFPYAGVIGVTALALLTLVIAHDYSI